MGLKSNNTAAGGEIIQVQGGHIIRAMGRKDRHSKVFTAKGPRDRRVRLSAHTAIQFYDVQDRLGFDRPSKAVDWLMKKAKDSIDKLAELPPWDPTTINVGGCTEIPVTDHTGSSYNQMHHHHQDVGECMKSFFPKENENQMSFQNQDLCLSLHTVQDDPGFHGPGSLGFDGGWTQQHQDVGRFTRMMGWASCGGGDGTRGGGGNYLYSNPPPPSPPPSFPQQGYFQRGTLQSSFSPFVGLGIGSGPESFMGYCNPSQIHGEGSMSNRASSSSLSPDGSSQH